MITFAMGKSIEVSPTFDNNIVFTLFVVLKYSSTLSLSNWLTLPEMYGLFKYLASHSRAKMSSEKTIILSPRASCILTKYSQEMNLFGLQVYNYFLLG